MFLFVSFFNFSFLLLVTNDDIGVFLNQARIATTEDATHNLGTIQHVDLCPYRRTKLVSV